MSYGGDIVPSGYRKGQLKQFDARQMKLYKSMFSQLGGGSYLSRLAEGDESLFEQMEAPAMKKFQELQGGLASRFSGMGMGARKGSGFANAANQQTADFAQQLQSQRQGLQRQAIMDLMGLSSNLLEQRPYDRFMVEKQQKQGGTGGWGGAGGAILGGAGGFLMGGPAMAMQGANIGFNVGSQF